MSPASAGSKLFDYLPLSSATSAFTSTCKFLLFVWIIVISVTDVCCELNKNYHINQLCKNTFLRQLYRKVDGATLMSQNERNLDCEITFQTHSILQRFMLRFDTLSLDCNDHLFVYDGGHAAGTPKIDISCRNTKQSVGVLFTNTNHITLKYVTDGWGTDSNGFKLVITAIKDPKHECRDFKCVANGFCIHPELLCDSVNHCSDGSDESVNAKCQNPTENQIFGMELTWIVLITMCSMLIIFAFLVGITICICRRNAVNNGANQNNNQNTNGNVYQTNINATNGSKHSTLPRDQTTRLPSEKMMMGENGINGNHTIPRNFNLCLETTSIDGASPNLKSLMGQDLLPQTNPTTKDEWFV
ncbi:CLUMA_CG000991, isoform A [Clunio marinus]|uniref:CLUMA_CG000991, isoform A n=1 Tax=Clunio marinus TaxID=568069 RepID=A0A1J1HGP5_9DIPT|nr:CLUMA_CG000991, isoform A [Clunio marinus]